MDPSQVIAVIASQIRLLFQVKRLYNSGKSNDEIAKILEFKSVYRVKYLLSDSYYYSEDTLIKYLSKLSNIDRDIKINNINIFLVSYSHHKSELGIYHIFLGLNIASFQIHDLLYP